MNNPIVSVVIPAYNASRFLEQNINSLFNQTLQDFEVIYVDDGSADDTYIKLLGYEKEDSRINVIKQSNKGAGVARNVGIQKARGKYLLVVDVDDYYAPDMLEKTVKQAEKDHLDIVIFDCYMFDDTTQKSFDCHHALRTKYLSGKEVFSREDIPDDIFRITGTCAWNKLYRREFVVNNHIEFQDIRQIDDLYFVMISLAMAERIGVCYDKLLYYRTNNNESQISNVTKMPDNFYYAYLLTQKQLIKNHLYDKVKKSFIGMAFLDCLTALERMQDTETYEYLYDRIKTKYIYDLNIADKDKDFFENESHYRLLTKLQSMTAVEYIRSELENSGMPSYVQNNRVVLYGAGVFGQGIYKLLRRYGRMVAWVDKRYEELVEFGLDVIDVQKIAGLEYDYIFIAVENPKVAIEISQELLASGIEESKIVRKMKSRDGIN